MKVFVTRADAIILHVHEEPTAEARSSCYWSDRCREVPDELVARYEALHKELEQVSVDIERAYGEPE
jgi:hypothetical protein